MKPRLIVALVVLLGSFTGVIAWRWANASAPPAQAPQAAPTTSSADPVDSADPAPAPPTTEVIAQRLAYVTTRPGTPLAEGPDEAATAVAGGILLPVLGELQGGYRVFDTCNTEGWVDAGEVDPGLVPADPQPGRFDQSVFVVDPGHGHPDLGAVGPTGLVEAEVNLDVASRLVDLLRSSHSIDWETGAIAEGEDVPAAGTTVLTRGPAGPSEGQFQLGLTYRATVANALDATALVSIHHNTAPETTLDHPGSEAFVSAHDPESPRLGGLIVQELRTTFARFEADWTGSLGEGVISRVGSEGDDYYTILNRSEVPAVIVEGAYISNPTEEALALTSEFRQAYAEAVYRAMVRFVTTDDYPIPAPEPTLWEVDRPPPSMSDCTVPAP